MKSVDEAMAIGRTFKESPQKCQQSPCYPFDPVATGKGGSVVVGFVEAVFDVVLASTIFDADADAVGNGRLSGSWSKLRYDVWKSPPNLSPKVRDLSNRP